MILTGQIFLSSLQQLFYLQAFWTTVYSTFLENSIVLLYIDNCNNLLEIHQNHELIIDYSLLITHYNHSCLKSISLLIRIISLRVSEVNLCTNVIYESEFYKNCPLRHPGSVESQFTAMEIQNRR